MPDPRFKLYATPAQFQCPFCGEFSSAISLTKALYDEFDVTAAVAERPVCSECFEDLSGIAREEADFEDFSIYSNED